MISRCEIWKNPSNEEKTIFEIVWKCRSAQKVIKDRRITQVVENGPFGVGWKKINHGSKTNTRLSPTYFVFPTLSGQGMAFI